MVHLGVTTAFTCMWVCATGVIPIDSLATA